MPDSGDCTCNLVIVVEGMVWGKLVWRWCLLEGGKHWTQRDGSVVGDLSEEVVGCVSELCYLLGDACEWSHVLWSEGAEKGVDFG